MAARKKLQIKCLFLANNDRPLRSRHVYDVRCHRCPNKIRDFYGISFCDCDSQLYRMTNEDLAAYGLKDDSIQQFRCVADKVLPNNDDSSPTNSTDKTLQYIETEVTERCRGGHSRWEKWRP